MELLAMTHMEAVRQCQTQRSLEDKRQDHGVQMQNSGRLQQGCKTL